MECEVCGGMVEDGTLSSAPLSTCKRTASRTFRPLHQWLCPQQHLEALSTQCGRQAVLQGCRVQRLRSRAWGLRSPCLAIGIQGLGLKVSVLSDWNPGLGA